MLSACCFALPPFQCFGLVDPSDDGRFESGQDVAYLCWAGPEELAALVDQVYPPAGELVMQVVFEADAERGMSGAGDLCGEILNMSLPPRPVAGELAWGKPRSSITRRV